MLTPKEIESIQKYFSKDPAIQSVFLFGSTAKGKARPASDVDLALWLDSHVSESDYLNKRLQVMGDLSSVISGEPDVVILNEAGPLLKHEVIKFGQVLYESAPKYTVDFKARAMIEYVDWLPYQKLLDDSVLRHFKGKPDHG